MNKEIAESISLPPDYGDWIAEYRAFQESCALLARSDRAVVRVFGERAAEMLDGLLSNSVVNLSSLGRPALLLSEKGRVLTDLRVFPRGDDLVIDVPVTGLQNLLATLKKYVPPIYARFENVSGDVSEIGVYGPSAPVIVARVLGEEALPEEHLGVQGARAREAELLVIRSRRLAGDGVEILGPVADLTGLWPDLRAAVLEAGGRPAGRGALEVSRTEWGIPRYGADMSDENLAQETGLEDAISFEKGCYLGQEVVARIHFRGHVNRHLRPLEFAGDIEPDPGARLYRDEKEVGVVTTAVSSPEFGPIGLGYVRREVEPPARLRWVQENVEGEATVRERPLRPGS